MPPNPKTSAGAVASKPWPSEAASVIRNLRTSLESIQANIEGERRRGREAFEGSTFAIENMIRQDVARANRALEVLDALTLTQEAPR